MVNGRNIFIKNKNRKNDRSFFRDGFSLVEMLIAMAVTSIVLVALLMILSYSMRSANITEARTGIQDAAKDAMNHISSHVQEANHMKWDKDHALFILQEDVYVTMAGKKKLEKKDKYYYYAGGGKLYFKNVSDGDYTLEYDNSHLLASDVDAFEAQPDKNESTVVHVKLEMKNSLASFSCSQDAHIRNKCKGGH